MFLFHDDIITVQLVILHMAMVKISWNALKFPEKKVLFYSFVQGRISQISWKVTSLVRVTTSSPGSQHVDTIQRSDWWNKSFAV